MGVQIWRSGMNRDARTALHSAIAALLIMLFVSVAAVSSENPARAAEPQEAKAIAVNDYEVGGVQVALLSVKRISDGTVTVKWEYRNKTTQAKPLGESFTGMGWSE